MHQNPKSTLIVKVSGYTEIKGSLRLRLDNGEAGYFDRQDALRSMEQPVRQKQHQFEISDLSFGTYTIKVFHDINDDLKLNQNLLGIPIEAYGFSQNARGRFGMPPYEDVKIEVSEARVEHSIKLEFHSFL